MDIITLTLIIANCIIHFLPFIVPFGNTPSSSFFIFQSWFAKSNVDINDGEYYRLLTANFLHADIIHLFVNMFSLYQIGPTVSRVYHNWGYALIFIISGLSGTFFSYLFNQSPSVGASGAIFGLVGALLAFAIMTGQYGLLANILIIVILNFSIALAPASRIDNWGHLGGLISGTITGFVLLYLR